MLLGEGNGNPLQYSYLENPMDGGAWWATVHRVAKSRIRLSDFTHSHIRAAPLPRRFHVSLQGAPLSPPPEQAGLGSASPGSPE